MMEYLRKSSGCRNAIDAVDLMSNMQQYFDKAASIPVYINMMETAQKKSDWSKLPISEYMSVAIATKAILASDCFPRATDAWEEKTDEDKTRD